MAREIPFSDLVGDGQFEDGQSFDPAHEDYRSPLQYSEDDLAELGQYHAWLNALREQFSRFLEEPTIQLLARIRDPDRQITLRQVAGAIDRDPSNLCQSIKVRERRIARDALIKHLNARRY